VQGQTRREAGTQSYGGRATDPAEPPPGVHLHEKDCTMPRRLRHKIKHQHGFSLIELLVVMLVIGVLAAIALPAFLNQEHKGHDADAKANARNLVSLVDACYTSKDDYRQCSDVAGLGDNIGIPYGSNPGEASVTDSTLTTYTVMAISNATTGGVHNTYSISRDAQGVISRSCNGGAGCHAGTW
jgi:type IV pilus assembly protein PilA